MSTFGDTTVEASSAGLADQALWAEKVTLPVDGTITDITARLASSGGTQTCKVLFYADDAGGARPGTLLATFSVSGITASENWYTGSGSYAATAGTYWLAVFNDGGVGLGTVRFKSSTGTDYFRSTGSSTPPNPAGAGGSAASNLLSIYATYTVPSTFVPQTTVVQ